MAEKEGMIEPFAPSQVRHANNRPLISYGVSSYGYDVRCAKNLNFHQPKQHYGRPQEL